MFALPAADASVGFISRMQLQRTVMSHPPTPYSTEMEVPWSKDLTKNTAASLIIEPPARTANCSG
jgi:hypothetical protein